MPDRAAQFQTEAAAADADIGVLGTLKNFALFTVDNTASLIGVHSSLAATDLAQQQLQAVAATGHAIDPTVTADVMANAKGAEEATLAPQTAGHSWVKWALIGGGAIAAVAALAYATSQVRAAAAAL